MASALYRLHQPLWTAWARRWYREEFNRVNAFCLFVGYPRSGHSVVGAVLNAHRHAVISHELQVPPLVLAGCDRDTLYARILARAAWFNLRGNTANYTYQVRNQWQGRFEALRVIGDKRGGSAALALAEHPDLLERIRATTGVPVRLIHVVRNPFDNIAAISLWHHMPLDTSIEYYFSHCQTTGRFDAPLEATDVVTIQHEHLIRSPETTLRGLCEFLELEPEPGYLADCSDIMYATPTCSRRRVQWSAAQRAEVERRMRRFSFFDGYTYEIDDEVMQDVGQPTRPRRAAGLWPRIVRRLFPTEHAPE